MTDRNSQSRRQLLSALAAVGGIALSGCAGLGGETPDGPMTAGPSTDAAPDTDTATDRSADDSGVLNGTALYVDATRRALVQNGYVLDQQYRVTGAESQAVATRVRSDRVDRRRRAVIDRGDGTTRRYTTAETRYTNAPDGTGRRYERAPLDRTFLSVHRPSGLASEAGLAGILGIGTYGPGQFIQRADGEMLRVPLERASYDGPGTVTGADGAVVLSASNIVYEARFALTIKQEGEERTREQVFVIEDIGSVDVEPPSWLGRIEA
jgi:hypothetical protein